MGWGIDNADSLIDGNGNIQVTARIVANGEGATIVRVAYHVVILGLTGPRTRTGRARFRGAPAPSPRPIYDLGRTDAAIRAGLEIGEYAC